LLKKAVAGFSGPVVIVLPLTHQNGSKGRELSAVPLRTAEGRFTGALFCCLCPDLQSAPAAAVRKNVTLVCVGSLFEF
jgi:hypothetical protein